MNWWSLSDSTELFFIWVKFFYSFILRSEFLSRLFERLWIRNRWNEHFFFYRQDCTVGSPESASKVPLPHWKIRVLSVIIWISYLMNTAIKLRVALNKGLWAFWSPWCLSRGRRRCILDAYEATRYWCCAFFYLSRVTFNKRHSVSYMESDKAPLYTQSRHASLPLTA